MDLPTGSKALARMMPWIVMLFLVGCNSSDDRVGVDDIQVSYQIHGEGYPLIMIMGYGGTKDMWDPNVIKALAAHYQVITFDNRGMGDTRAGTRDFSIEQFADDTAGLMDALDIPQANVLAWSMGTEIAFELVLRHPDKVNKLVQYAGDCDIHMFPPSPEVFAILSDTSGTPEERGQRMLSIMYPADWLSNNREYVRHVYSQVTEVSSPANIQKQNAAMDRWGGCTQRLKNIHKPVLLVTGTEDVLTPPQNSYFLLQHLPGSRLLTFEHGGHGAMNQFPDEFANAVINFFGLGKGTGHSGETE